MAYQRSSTAVQSGAGEFDHIRCEHLDTPDGSRRISSRTFGESARAAVRARRAAQRLPCLLENCSLFQDSRRRREFLAGCQCATLREDPGFPMAPRATVTPSTPVSSIIRTQSAAVNKSRCRESSARRHVASLLAKTPSDSDRWTVAAQCDHER